jgi:hypothetical protein
MVCCLVCAAAVACILTLYSSILSAAPDPIDQEGFQINLASDILAVQIHLGCNVNPPLPPANKSIAVIAVEPVAGSAARIPHHDRLYVIVCAIADVERFQSMNLYNIGGLSSSLLKRSKTLKHSWYIDMDYRKGKSTAEYERERRRFQPLLQIVPVMPLRMLLNAIAPEIDILHLSTDLQV